MKRSGFLNVLASVLTCLAILAALGATYLNSLVMGEAALGIAVWSPEKGSPDWQWRATRLWWANTLTYAGFGFALAGAILQAIGAKRV